MTRRHARSVTQGWLVKKNETRHRSRCQQVATGADYTAEETEFLKAVEAFRRQPGKSFPAWTEILALLRSLGYRKTAAASH